MSDITTILDSELYQTGQGYALDRAFIVIVSGVHHKIRTKVYRDSYDNQSRFRAERWNGQQWHEVVTIAGQSNHGKSMESTYAEAKKQELSAVRMTDLLLTEAVQILS